MSKDNFNPDEHSCERVGGFGSDYSIYKHNDKWVFHIFDNSDNDCYIEDIQCCPFCSTPLKVYELDKEEK